MTDTTSQTRIGSPGDPPCRSLPVTARWRRVGLLGALGVGIALNEAVWAGAIVLFAALAVAALALRWRRHGRGLRFCWRSRDWR